MEILSIGEKVKRARIYKDCTLKELCGDKISISKMSCIENDKVKPERWIIEFIAEKLDMDKDYLDQGVREQILSNIDKINNYVDYNNHEKYIQYNLEFALEYNYFDLAFQLMHMLFEYYIDTGKVENIQIITSRYYDVCTKSQLEDNFLTYNKDMARYFFINKEYNQAAVYYSNLVSSIRGKNIDNYGMLASLMYKEAVCYIMLKDYVSAYTISKDIVSYIDYISIDSEKAEIYEMLALLSLRMRTGNFEFYEEKSYRYYNQSYEKKARAMYCYSEAMFELGLKDKAIGYITEGLQVHPKENNEAYTEYTLCCVSELVKNEVLEKAQEVCDEALNSSIKLDNIRFIERAYYYKSRILERQGNLMSAEMYMNLSLDALFKFGNTQQKYERYIEMGNMYHKLGHINDSLKYFSLAMTLKKKM